MQSVRSLGRMQFSTNAASASPKPSRVATKIGRRREPVDLSDVCPPIKAYKTSPKNESRLHFVTKSHLCDQLNRGKTLSLLKPCKTKQNPSLPSLSLFTCTNTLEHPNWLSGWHSAKVEHSVRGIGKFDVALLKEPAAAARKQATAGDLVGVVEIIHKSPMTEEKVNELNAAKIPWVEVSANASLWLSHSRWTTDQPLPVYRSSDPEWTCEMCQRGQDGLRLKRIAAIVDIYPSTSTKNQWGCIQRKIYGIYERDQELFLIEGNYVVITGWLQWFQINKEALFIATTSDIAKQHQPTFSPPQMPSPADESLSYLRACYDDILKKIFEEDDPDAIVQPVLRWPGLSMEQVEQSDELRHLVNYHKTNSLPDYYGTIARLYGHHYLWDKKRHSWIRNVNATT